MDGKNNQLWFEKIPSFRRYEKIFSNNAMYRRAEKMLQFHVVLFESIEKAALNFNFILNLQHYLHPHITQDTGHYSPHMY